MINGTKLTISKIVYLKKSTTSNKFTIDSDPGVPINTNDTNLCTCDNVINGIRYIITYDEDGYVPKSVTA